MIATEKEAAMKYCPQPTAFTVCAASRCMAWRWFYSPFQRTRMPDEYCEPGSPEPQKPITVPASWTWNADADAQDGGHWLEPEEEARAGWRGYCGLAGKIRGGA
jgi:hypothetical protein